jgi:uncharacterized membrane protein
MSQSEILLFILGTGALVTISANWRTLRVLPRFRLLFASFAVLYTGYLFTNLEELVLPNALNIVEHGLHAVSSALFLLWVVQVMIRDRRRK